MRKSRWCLALVGGGPQLPFLFLVSLLPVSLDSLGFELVPFYTAPCSFLYCQSSSLPISPLSPSPAAENLGKWPEGYPGVAAAKG